MAFPVRAAVLLPSSADVQLEPGASTTQLWRVINDSGRNAQYRVELQGVHFGKIADEVQFVPLSTEERSWFAVTPNVFSLSAEESGEVMLQIAIPEEVENQVKTVAVLVVEETGQASGIGLQEAVAGIAFITIGESVGPTVRIDDFQVFQDHPWRGPVRFAVALTNTAGGVAQPQVQVVIRDIFGRVVEVLHLNQLGKRLPAETTRAYTADWSGPVIGFGPYRADLVVLPADGAELIGRRADVVLFTWQSGAILAAITGAGVLLGWGGRRYLKR